MIAATQTLSYHYSDSSRSALPYGIKSDTAFLACLEINSPFENVPVQSKRNLLATISATRIASNAFGRVFESFHKGKVVKFGNSVVPINTHLPSLKKYNAHQLFDIEVLQSHCSINSGYYSLVKPFFEEQFSEEETFENIWQNLNKNNFECTRPKRRCEDAF